MLPFIWKRKCNNLYGILLLSRATGVCITFHLEEKNVIIANDTVWTEEDNDIDCSSCEGVS